MTQNQIDELLRQANESRLKALDNLGPLGVVDIEQLGDLFVFVYADGYRHEISEREMKVFPRPVVEMLPKRPQALH